MEDHELERRARRLGARAEQQIDVDRVAERVVAQLRVQGHRAGNQHTEKRGVRRLVQIAAVLAVLVAGGILMRDSGEPTIGAPGFAARGFAVPVALDDLSEAELSDVLDSLELAGPVRHVGDGGIDDLSDAELEQLLAMIES